MAAISGPHNRNEEKYNEMRAKHAVSLADELLKALEE